MKKYILRIDNQDVCVVFGNRYEFEDDMMIIYLDEYIVGSFKIYIDGVKVIQSDVFDGSEVFDA